MADDKKKLEKCEIKKEHLQATYDALLNQLKVLQADFENYKKRVEKENCELSKSANCSIVKDLLPVIDSFEKALPFVKDEGVKMIFSNLKKTLEKHGLSEIKTAGEKFDVNKHEAVMTVSGKGEDNAIVEEVEKGYMFSGKILRPSKVIVNKKA